MLIPALYAGMALSIALVALGLIGFWNAKGDPVYRASMAVMGAGLVALAACIGIIFTRISARSTVLQGGEG